MPEEADLLCFYERAYASSAPALEAQRGRWRALSAVTKAKHVIALLDEAGLVPRSTLDVGCGDGALLSELRRGKHGGRLEGVEVASTAVRRAESRPEIDAVTLYDGARLPAQEGAFDLGLLMHVLEHVPDPSALLRETARVCAAVVVEVPLEENLSARRRSRRDGARQIGHLHSLSRADVRGLVAESGLRVACEIEDALPLSVHRFFARGTLATASAFGRWAVRTLTHRLAPSLARRLFTVHYACLCTKQT